MFKTLILHLVFLLFHFCFIQNVVADQTNARKIHKDDFVCADIAFIDHGMALDRNGEFIDANSQQLICTVGMHFPYCADYPKGQTCICPPPRWDENKCSEKYSKYYRIKDMERIKTYDRIIKKQK